MKPAGMLAPGVEATTIEISLARAGVGVNGRAWSNLEQAEEPRRTRGTRWRTLAFAGVVHRQACTLFPGNRAPAGGAIQLHSQDWTCRNSSAEGAGWAEVEWFYLRFHASGADYRRIVRVLMKPIRRLPTFLADVNQQIKTHQNPLPEQPGSLRAAALVTEGLLIDRTGHVVPSSLTYKF